MNRKLMTDYITFAIRYIEKENLLKAFQDKNVAIDNQFYEDIVKLKDLYDQMTDITQLIQYIPENESQRLDNTIFGDFHSLYLDLINRDYNVIQTRFQIAEHYLNLPFVQTIMKYDFYLEGKIDFKMDIDHPKVVVNKTRMIIGFRMFIKVYDLKTKELEFILNDQQEIDYIKLLSDDLILVGKWKGKITIWNLHTKEQERSPDTTLREDDISLFPDGRFAFKGLYDTFSIWNPKIGKEEFTIEHQNPDEDFPEALTVLRDGRVIISTSYHELQIWAFRDIPKKEVSFQNDEHVSKIIELDDGRIVTQSSYVIKIWSSTGQLQTTLIERIFDMLVIPDGKLITSSQDHILKIWDLNTGIQLTSYQFDNTTVSCMTMLPSNDVILGFDTGIIGILDSNGLKFIREKNDEDYIESIHILPNNQILIASDNDITFWS